MLLLYYKVVMLIFDYKVVMLIFDYKVVMLILDYKVVMLILYYKVVMLILDYKVVMLILDYKLILFIIYSISNTALFTFAWHKDYVVALLNCLEFISVLLYRYLCCSRIPSPGLQVLINISYFSTFSKPIFCFIQQCQNYFTAIFNSKLFKIYYPLSNKLEKI